MSVNGEFLRVLGSYVELLESADASGTIELAARLREIHDAEREDWGGRGLDRAARDVLDELRPGGAIARLRFARIAERESFEADTEHLVSLCRAISGAVDP